MGAGAAAIGAGPARRRRRPERGRRGGGRGAGAAAGAAAAPCLLLRCRLGRKSCQVWPLVVPAALAAFQSSPQCFITLSASAAPVPAKAERARPE